MTIQGQKPVWFASQGVLLIGYDVELGGHVPGKDVEFCTTDRFLKAATQVHRELKAPCTMFVCGITAEQNREAFQPLLGDPLFNLEQHTYAHVSLKAVVKCGPNGEMLYHRAHVGMEELTLDIEKAQDSLTTLTGRRPIGMCAPWSCAGGLFDRWDLVQLLHQAGIRFCRTYARKLDGSDVYNLAIDPFWYELQGFPDVLEIPIGEPCDVHVRPWIYPTIKAYSNRLDAVLEEVARHKYVFSYATHDHSAPLGDPELDVIRRLITRARELGIAIMTHEAYYQKCLTLQ